MNTPDGITRVTCFCDADLVHSSDAVTGLIELADAGEIDLRFQLHDPSVSRRRGMWALWLRISTNAEQGLGVCIDCHDAHDYYCPDGLAACRLYFKSNLRPDTFAAVPPEYRAKLRPFGPYLPCRPRRDRARTRRRLGSAYTKLRHLSFVSSNKRSWRERLMLYFWELKRLQRYDSRNVWCDYEAGPDRAVPQRPTILFNPTCWDENGVADVRAINERRAQLIIALRREFGERFIGGFRNFGTSVAGYPEAVEPRTLSHDEYVRLLQASPITVYVNGVSGCFSWRLAENFAAGQCMVSERIVNDAGFPLDESAGIVQCDTIAEMVESLRRLSDSPQQMRTLSENSRRTYVERLRPHVRMRQIIQESLGRDRSDSRNFAGVVGPSAYRLPDSLPSASEHAPIK